MEFSTNFFCSFVASLNMTVYLKDIFVAKTNQEKQY